MSHNHDYIQTHCIQIQIKSKIILLFLQVPFYQFTHIIVCVNI